MHSDTIPVQNSKFNHEIIKPIFFILNDKLLISPKYFILKIKNQRSSEHFSFAVLEVKVDTVENRINENRSNLQLKSRLAKF